MSVAGRAGRSDPLLNRQPPTVVYDAACAFCCRWAEWFRRGSGGRVRLLPLQDPDAAKVTGKSAGELLEAMHYVTAEGAVFAGASAVREALRQVRGGWVVRGVMAIPGAMRVADRVYAWVARRRGGCDGRHCSAVARDCEKR